MTLNEIFTILAILAGPILAVQVEKYLSKLRDQKENREDLFKSLMLTRAKNLTEEHVDSLNMIALEFPIKKYRKVNDAWKEYLDHLNDKSYGEARIDEWERVRQDKFVDLLYVMSEALNFKYEKLLIKRQIYIPQGHILANEEFEELKEKILELLDGKRSLNIKTKQ
ncbi:DUF6680 family protein [Leptospira sp. 'Mane']|uniref:DUF6680 family protein n=1 Tax=Leptospira sp. 'Mane' TaxID=3387407 RepID=UPI00398ACB68